MDKLDKMIEYAGIIVNDHVPQQSRWPYDKIDCKCGWSGQVFRHHLRDITKGFLISVRNANDPVDEV